MALHTLEGQVRIAMRTIAALVSTLQAVDSVAPGEGLHTSASSTLAEWMTGEETALCIQGVPTMLCTILCAGRVAVVVK